MSTVPPTTTETYTYDKVGNRLSSLGVTPYAYNTSNQLTSKPGTTYTYDANGNALSKTDLSGTTSYSWDFENRLVSVVLPGTAGTVTFKYDPFGRRVQKGSATGTTVFAYDGDNLIEELSATGLVTAQYTQGLGIDEALAMYRGGAAFFYHADGLGSIAALTDTTGSPAAAYVYDSFGNTFPAPGSVTNPFRYTAREFDAETGLYYYRARYYDPAIGRFLSEDPSDADPTYDESNLYKYVRNSPTNFLDPLGLYSVKPGVPGPSPALVRLLTCMDGCLGIQVLVTATTPLPGEKHQDPGHKAGTSVDIRPPKGIPANKVFCCAGQCGAQWGINEGPGGQRTPDTTAPNYHLQLFPPHHPSPRAPNAIPPSCKPGGCSPPN